MSMDLHLRERMPKMSGPQERDDTPRPRRRILRPGLLAAVCLGVATHLMWPVLRTPFLADDIANSQFRSHFAVTDDQPAEMIGRINENWVRAEGRFFPVSIAEGVLFWSRVSDRQTYKVIQLLAPLVVITLVGVLIAIFTRDRWLGVGAMAFLVPLHQFRRFHDPITQFGLQQPSVTAKILGALVLVLVAVRATTHLRFSVLMGAAAMTWTLAVLHYETAYPLVVLPLGLVLLETQGKRVRRWVGLGAIAIPTALLALYVVHLRAEAPPAKAPGYTINLEADRVAETFGYQVTGALPLSYPAFAGGDVPAPAEALEDAGVLSLASGLVLGAVVVIALKRARRIGGRGALVLAGGGAVLLAMPAAVISTSLRWQSELSWGLPYIPVFQQAVGVALLATGAVTALRELASGRSRPARLGISGVVVAITVVFVAAVPITRVMNDWAADDGAGVRQSRDVFDRAAPSGFFDVLDDTSVLSPHANGVFWFNGEYLEWLGGPEKVPFANSVPADRQRCIPSKCTADGRTLWYATDWSNPDGLFVIWLAPVVSISGDGSDLSRVIVDLRRARARAHVDGQDIDRAPLVSAQLAMVGASEPLTLPGRAGKAWTEFRAARAVLTPVTNVSFSLVPQQ